MRFLVAQADPDAAPATTSQSIVGALALLILILIIFAVMFRGLRPGSSSEDREGPLSRWVPKVYGSGDTDSSILSLSPIIWSTVFATAAVTQLWIAVPVALVAAWLASKPVLRPYVDVICGVAALVAVLASDPGIGDLASTDRWWWLTIGIAGTACAIAGGLFSWSLAKVPLAVAFVWVATTFAFEGAITEGFDVDNPLVILAAVAAGGLLAGALPDIGLPLAAVGVVVLQIWLAAVWDVGDAGIVVGFMLVVAVILSIQRIFSGVER